MNTAKDYILDVKSDTDFSGFLEDDEMTLEVWFRTFFDYRLGKNFDERDKVLVNQTLAQILSLIEDIGVKIIVETVEPLDDITFVCSNLHKEKLLVSLYLYKDKREGKMIVSKDGITREIVFRPYNKGIKRRIACHVNTWEEHVNFYQEAYDRIVLKKGELEKEEVTFDYGEFSRQKKIDELLAKREELLIIKDGENVKEVKL